MNRPAQAVDLELILLDLIVPFGQGHVHPRIAASHLWAKRSAD
jgi:hypothetical protein